VRNPTAMLRLPHMNPYKYKISLRVRDKNSDLRELYESLQRVPGILLRRLNQGNTHIKGNLLPGVYSESMFGFAFSKNAESSDSVSLECAVQNILDALQPFRAHLKKLGMNGGSAAFFIGLFIDSNSGIVLDTDLLERIATYGMSLEFDIYPPDQPKDS
jgi:hypothetical protein